MVDIEYSPDFQKAIQKMKDLRAKEKVVKQIKKIIKDPESGKPMRYGRKGTRELYISPFRLSYSYFDNKIVFLELYHKDKQ